MHVTSSLKSTNTTPRPVSLGYIEIEQCALVLSKDSTTAMYQYAYFNITAGKRGYQLMAENHATMTEWLAHLQVRCAPVDVWAGWTARHHLDRCAHVAARSGASIRHAPDKTRVSTLLIALCRTQDDCLRSASHSLPRHNRARRRRQPRNLFHQRATRSRSDPHIGSVPLVSGRPYPCMAAASRWSLASPAWHMR